MRNQPPSAERAANGDRQYGFDGFKFLVDHEGSLGIRPPWGLLNCFDLNTGKALWRVPLGELEETDQKGCADHGLAKVGGATVTAGGLVFVARTRRYPCVDAYTGKELWNAKLPYAGTGRLQSTRSTGQTVRGDNRHGWRARGGKSGPGDTYVAFGCASNLWVERCFLSPPTPCIHRSARQAIIHRRNSPSVCAKPEKTPSLERFSPCIIRVC